MSAPQSVVDEVTRQVAADKYPTLTPQEISDIIEATVRFQPWQPATVYLPGQFVLPSKRTGVVWRALIEGTSGTSEPDWLLIWDQDYPYYFQDNTVVWQAGVADDSISLYDPRKAIYECWLLKASKTTGDFQYSAGDAGSANPTVIYQNCISQANRYRPWSIT